MIGRYDVAELKPIFRLSGACYPGRYDTGSGCTENECATIRLHGNSSDFARSSLASTLALRIDLLISLTRTRSISTVSRLQKRARRSVRGCNRGSALSPHSDGSG